VVQPGVDGAIVESQMLVGVGQMWGLLQVGELASGKGMAQHPSRLWRDPQTSMVASHKAVVQVGPEVALFLS
jgi:hypothetical protein